MYTDGHWGGGGGGVKVLRSTHPRRRQENKGEFINHINVSSLLRIKLNCNEGYADQYILFWLQIIIHIVFFYNTIQMKKYIFFLAKYFFFLKKIMFF